MNLHDSAGATGEIDATQLAVPGAPEGGKRGEEGAVEPSPAAPTPLLSPSPLFPDPDDEDAPERGDPAEVFVPAPAVNPVLAALKRRGLYREALAGGQHAIQCPWSHQHHGGDHQLATYCEPTQGAPAGTFHCGHAHTGRPRIRELLSNLDVDPTQARCRPTIRLHSGEMAQIVDWAEKVLGDVGGFYQANGTIVSVRIAPDSGDVFTELATEQTLTRALSFATDWERFDGRSKTWVRCDPQPRIVVMLLKARDYRHLPLLEGLARQPYLRADGSLVAAAGYDKGARVYGVFDPDAFQLPEPTEEAARASLAELKGLLEEFPFASDKDQSAPSAPC